jgi:hypothetical protein
VRALLLAQLRLNAHHKLAGFSYREMARKLRAWVGMAALQAELAAEFSMVSPLHEQEGVR